jgi:hypothetical protein
LREDVIKEIKDSEERYVEGLCHLEHFYINPLKLIVTKSRSDPKGMITMKEFNNLFQSIFVIKAVNSKLLDSLKCLAAGKSNKGEDTVGKIFLKIGPMLKTYADYVNNYEKMSRDLKELRRTKPIFDTFMTDIEKKAMKDGKVGFISYMVSPVQRIPRYTLLLRELLKYTDKTDEEYQNLEKALELTHAVSVHVNNRLHEVEQRKKLIDLHRSVPTIAINIKNFVQNPRRIIFDGAVFMRKKVLLAEKPREYNLYLMNDLILLVRKNRYKYHALLNESPRLWLFADEANQYVFTIVTANRVLHLQVESEELRNEWVNKINDAIGQSQKLINSPRNEIPKAVLYRNINKKNVDTKIVIAQAENDNICPFVAGDYLIVHYKYLDGSSLVSLAKDNTCAVKVRNILFREMTNEEKLSCEFISSSEKQKIIKELSNVSKPRESQDLSSLTEQGNRKGTRAHISLDHVFTAYNKMLQDGTLNAQQATVSRDRVLLDLLQQVSCNSSDDFSTEDTVDDLTEDLLSDVSDGKNNSYCTVSPRHLKKSVPSLPQQKSEVNKSPNPSPRACLSRRDSLGSLIRGIISPLSSPRASDDTNAKSPRQDYPSKCSSVTSSDVDIVKSSRQDQRSSAIGSDINNAKSPRQVLPPRQLPNASGSDISSVKIHRQDQPPRHLSTKGSDVSSQVSPRNNEMQHKSHIALPNNFDLQSALNSVQLRKSEPVENRHQIPKEEKEAPWLIELKNRNNKVLDKLVQQNTSSEKNSN